MGFWERIKLWLAKRQSKDPAERIHPALYRLAHDYETFPKLVPLKGGGWAVTAPRYRPAMGSTPEEAIRKFRRQNPRVRHP